MVRITRIGDSPDCITYRFGPAIVAFHGIAGSVSNWKVDREDPESFEKIVNVLPRYVDSVRMPIPTDSNALIAHPDDFKRTFVVGEDVRISDGVKADGCIIPPYHSFGIVSADCATIVAHCNAIFLIAAHAGRDSVIDRDAILGKPATRMRFGVVHAILSMARRAVIPKEVLHIGVFGGIRSRLYHDPDHEAHGAYNRALVRYCSDFEGAVLDEKRGEIDMYAVIRGIAISLGIPAENIAFDDVDTGKEELVGGKRRFASHRHGTPGTRNLTLVSRVQ